MEEKYNFSIENNYANEEIVFALNDNKKVPLNSVYNTTEFINMWCNQYDISNPHSVAIIYGISDGSYINKLREINKDMYIVVYEPEFDLLTYAIQRVRKDERMFFFSEKDDTRDFFGTAYELINFANYKYVRLYISPNYEILYKDKVKEFYKIFGDMLINIMYSRNTSYVLGQSFACGLCNNLIDYIKQYSLYGVYDCFEKKFEDGRPIVLVSAGPSLDKNINDLKEAKGKAFIIAVDTALNALAKADVIPDICVTVDPEKPPELFANEKMVNVPLVYQLVSNPKIKDVHKGIRIYQDSISSPLDIYVNKYKKTIATLETGGSVANSAFSLARHLGTKTVIFIGQDLAYPNGQEHATGSFANKNNYIDENNHKKYFYVESNSGDKILTEASMNKYRVWFEREILCCPEIRFINATEGGAKINGMEVMTLKEAIQQTCENVETVDFTDMFNNMKPSFTDEQRKEILEYLSKYDEEISRIRKKFRNGLKLYEKLDELNRKGIYSGKTFDSNYKKIKELNDWVIKGSDVAYLSNFTYFDDYEVMGDVYDKKDSVYEDIDVVVKGGVRTLNALIKATDVVLLNLEDTISEAKELLKDYE